VAIQMLCKSNNFLCNAKIIANFALVKRKNIVTNAGV
jgi:hypothetical protein